MSPDTAILLLDIAWWAALVGLLLVMPFAAMLLWLWLGREQKMTRAEIMRKILRKK